MGWKREPLREEELDELLEAAARHGLVYDFTVRTLAHTGLRAAEFAHLTSDWIDWQGEKLRVPPETDDGWTPKTDHAVRTIPLKEPETFRVMREFFKRHEAVDVTRQAVRNRVVKVARDTEIMKKVTPHVLRHTYGTLIAARGATPQYIRQTMGHADLSSANNYLQYAGTQLDSEAEELW
jgi:integrase/recombinase XerD